MTAANCNMIVLRGSTGVTELNQPHETSFLFERVTDGQSVVFLNIFLKVNKVSLTPLTVNKVQVFEQKSEI